MYEGIPNGFDDSSNLDSIGATFVRENISPSDKITGFPFAPLGMFMAVMCYISVSVLNGNERLVFFRETSTGQSVVAYFLSKTVETMVFVPIYAAAYLLLMVNNDDMLIQSNGTFYLFTTLAIFSMFAVGYLCALLFEKNANLISLVVNLVITLSFTGIFTAPGDASSFQLGLFKCFPNFWFTQGIVTEEYEQYKSIFDITMLNSLTPGGADLGFGVRTSEAGDGMGNGYDLGQGVGGNTGYCILALFGWYLLVLLTMKMSSFKKHR